MNKNGAPLFVVASGSHYHGVHRSARGITDALGERAQVLFVDPPASIATKRPDLLSGKQAARGSVIQESSTVFRLAPNVPPGKDRAGMRHVTTRMVARQIRSAAAQLKADRWILFQQSAHHSVMGRIGEQMAIYHASDDLTAGASLLGIDPAAMARAERRAARAADIVLAVSRDLVERWSNLGAHVEFFPNAVDASAFANADTARPAMDVTLSHPVAGVVGTLSERLDMDLLHAVADRMSLLLVGPESFRTDRSGFEALIERDVVQWVGPKPFESLGSYYRHIDVALVPYTLSTFNQASFPLKTLEYLAAGRQVVSTRLRMIDDLQAPGVTFASTPDEFAVAALRQARVGASPESAAPLKTFAGQHDWATRATQLVEIAVETDHAI